MMIWTTLLIELKKLLRRGRSYIGIIAVIIILILIEAGLYADGQGLLDSFINNLKENFYLQGNLLNGYLVTYFALNTLWIHIPILIVIVTGDLVSGESSSGTFRIYLTRPVTRSAVLTGKFLTALVYCILLVVFLAIFSFGLGIMVFGKGDLIVLIKGIVILPSKGLAIRFLLAFLYGMIGMCTVGSLAFLFSCIYDNSMTPILITMAIVIIFTILSNFEIGLFDWLKPFLFTTYLGYWREFFNFSIDKKMIIGSGLVLMVHILFFYLISLWVFKQKEITS